MQPDRRAILRGLIGKPYRIGAEGPDAFDCYGLARHILREIYAVHLPESSQSPIIRKAWRRVPGLIDGAVVLMGQKDTHIGVCVANGVIHALAGIGVVFDDVHSLHFRGLGHLRIYQPT